MRILQLTSFDLFPPVHGGSSIAYNFVKHVAGRHQVTCLLSRLYSLGGTPDLQGENTRIAYCPPSRFDRLRVLSFIVNPHYYRAATRLVAECRPDVVQCETLWPALTGWYLNRRHGLPWLCVEYNVETDKFASLGRSQPLISLLFLLERFVCRRADAIVTLSARDRQRLLEQYDASPRRTHVITPGPDLQDFRFDEASRQTVRARYGLQPDQPLLTFVGNLQYEPNQAAVRRIAEEIFPRVRSQYPQATFLIIGQGAYMLSQYLREGLAFTGYLSRAELVAHLCATDVFLVPVESGAGIRVKIPEATACGRAVVCTAEAASGLELFAGDELVRVPDAGESFAAAVSQLIENPALREALGGRARARTEAAFGWGRTIAAYEAVYASMGLSV
jgi:glycosyltransferase involved in cell wall biosynthesis